MGKEETKPNRDNKTEKRIKSKKSKSSVQTLATEYSLSDSKKSGSHLSEHAGDEGNCAGHEEYPRRSANATLHSSTSTATMTSIGSSNGNNSHSHSSRSPRTGTSPRKSPGCSPRPCLRQVSSGDNLTEAQVAREIAALPFESSEDDRRQENIGRRVIGDRGIKSNEGPPQDGNGLYYQLSKASLHNKNRNLPTKKPQRIRNRVVRRKSLGEIPDSSRQSSDTSKSSKESSGKRSKSCEPQGVNERKPLPPNTKSRKKTSPKASRSGKKPININRSSTPGNNSNSSVNESWMVPQNPENNEHKDQRTEKMKRKKQIPNTKSSQKKETKHGKEEGRSRMIGFLEDVATKQSNEAKTGFPREDRSGGLFKKAASAKNVSRSRSPAKVHAHRHERRSSAPAKAFAAFNQYRKSMLPAEFDYNRIDDDPSPPPSLRLPKEKMLLDVSELAALQIIRLGKDNSLKLDVYDLVEHLRKQQL